MAVGLVLAHPPVAHNSSLGWFGYQGQASNTLVFSEVLTAVEIRILERKSRHIFNGGPN